MLAERAELRKQVQEAQKKTLLQEQRGSRTEEDLKNSAIVARAAKLVEHEMARKPTSSFIKQARQTLTEIEGDFGLKAAEEAKVKKQIRSDSSFSLANQNFNRHCELLEHRRTFDALKAKPSLGAPPAIQGALDGKVGGAVLLGEMTQLQDQIQSIKSSDSRDAGSDPACDFQQQMEAVLAEIDAIDPSEFLKELPEVRTTTPSTISSETSSSWSTSTSSYQSSMLRA